MRNLESARELGYYFSIHTVVRREIVDEVIEIHALARRLGASQHKLILTLQNLGRGRHGRDQAQLGLHEIFTLLERLPRQEFWDYGWDPEPTRDTRLMTTLPPALQPPVPRSRPAAGAVPFSRCLPTARSPSATGSTTSRTPSPATCAMTRLRISGDGAIHRDPPLVRRGPLGVCANCKVRERCRGLCRASAIGEYGDLRAPYPMCQALYDEGLFPSAMLVRPDFDSSYGAAA